MTYEGSPVVITNIYPYVINTGLMSGLDSLMQRYIMSTLKQEEVAQRVYRATMHNEREVYIPFYTYWMATLLMIIGYFSEDLRIYLI